METWSELTTEADAVRVFHGDSRDVLKAFPDNHFDSVVCDPPYALVSITKRFGAEGAAPAQVGASGAYARASAGFMGQKWDTGETAFAVTFWAEVMRVLKPGGHVIAFSGTRTYHRLAVAIEDAGFEIRDMVAWLYGSGFPKSHDVSKGIDKRRDDRPDILAVTTFVADAADAQGITRAQIDAHMGTSDMGGWWTSRLAHRCACPKWDQWLRLKALLSLSDDMDSEVWRLNGRKGTPGEAWGDREIIGQGESGISEAFGEGQWESGKASFDITAPATDAARQWQGWGTALKPALEPIVLARKPLIGTVAGNVLQHGTGALNIDASRIGRSKSVPASGAKIQNGASITRANPDAVGTGFDPNIGRWPANVIHDGSEEVTGAFPETGAAKAGGKSTGRNFGQTHDDDFSKDRDRTEHDDAGGSAARFFYSAKADAEDRLGSKHPTVKRVDLMAYLVRLVTPPGGLTLDPFAGSGSTGLGAMREGMRCALIEREDAYIGDIVRKLAWAKGEGRLTALEVARLDTPEKHAAASGAGLPLFGDA